MKGMKGWSEVVGAFCFTVLLCAIYLPAVIFDLLWDSFWFRPKTAEIAGIALCAIMVLLALITGVVFPLWGYAIAFAAPFVLLWVAGWMVIIVGAFLPLGAKK